MGIEQLVGHRFPGGTYTIEHWENYLLTEATGREPMPDDLVHPIHLFHVPISGVGTSIAELFELAAADGPDMVGLDRYDWEWFAPLREDVTYRLEGEITEAERRENEGRPYDQLVFRIDVLDEGSGADAAVVARVTNTWHFWRRVSS